MKSAIPDKEGWYWLQQEGEEPLLIEVYWVPYCDCLCIWQDDYHPGVFQQTVTEGDEMCGHTPVSAFDAEWKFVKDFD